MCKRIQKILISLTTALVLVIPLTATVIAMVPTAQAATETPAKGNYPPDAYVIRVDGLACPYCAYGIEKEFSTLDGTRSTDVNIEQGVVVVHVKPGTDWSAQTIKQTVNDAGFTLKRVVQRPQVH